MRTQKPENYELPNHFYSTPGYARENINSKQLKSLMLKTGGRIVTQGSFFDIKKKSLGSGIYEIYLEERERGLDLNAPNTKTKTVNTKSQVLQLDLKNKIMALEYMVKEFEKVSGKSREELPLFVLENLK